MDQDEKTDTRKNVFWANDTYGHLLEAEGCHVSVAEWPADLAKGFDDLVVNCGVDTACNAIDNAIPLWPKLESSRTSVAWTYKGQIKKEEAPLLWALKHRLKRIADLRVDIPTIENINPEQLPLEGILALVSQKGTGKTKLIAGTLATAPEGPQLLAGHRIALMRNLCSRLGMTYRGDLDQAKGRFIEGNAYSISIGTCVDSLINPAFWHENFRGCDLVLDEVMQVIRHMLTSATCSRDGKRNAILRRFEALVKVARRIIIADADLDDHVIDYIERLRGDGRKAFLLRNDYQPTPWDVSFIESDNSSAITNQFLEDLKAGRKIFLATDSKAASNRLYELAKTTISESSILLINSDTSGGEIEQRFITTPDDEVLDYRLVIATPSMSTGTSVEKTGHFDNVYGIFYGQSSTDADMLQALARVRDPVERIVWCAKKGGAFSRVTRDSNPEAVKRALKEQLSATASILAGHLDTGIKDSISGYEWDNPHVELFSHFEASRNRSMWELRSALKVRLIDEGHNVSILNFGEHKATTLLLKEARAKLKQDYALSVVNAPDIDQVEANALAKAEKLSPQEKLALEKFRLTQFYKTEVTPELVTHDDEGSYRRQLARLEVIIYPELAASRDISDLNRQAQWQAGLTPWDAPSRAVQLKVREKLGLTGFLDPERTWDNDVLEDFKATALSIAAEIKQALNIVIGTDMKPCQILGMCLNQIGLKTKSRQHRIDGERKRIYQPNPEACGMAFAVIERRRAARQEQPEVSHTPPKGNIYRGVCDTIESLSYSPNELGSSQLPPLDAEHAGTVPESPAELTQIEQVCLGILQTIDHWGQVLSVKDAVGAQRLGQLLGMLTGQQQRSIHAMEPQGGTA